MGEPQMLSEDRDTLSEQGCWVWTGCSGSDTGLCSVAMLEPTELLPRVELLAGEADALEEVSAAGKYTYGLNISLSHSVGK